MDTAHGSCCCKQGEFWGMKHAPVCGVWACLQGQAVGGTAATTDDRNRHLSDPWVGYAVLFNRQSPKRDKCSCTRASVQPGSIGWYIQAFESNSGGSCT